MRFFPQISALAQRFPSPRAGSPPGGGGERGGGRGGPGVPGPRTSPRPPLSVVPAPCTLQRCGLETHPDPSPARWSSESRRDPPPHPAAGAPGAGAAATARPRMQIPEGRAGAASPLRIKARGGAPRRSRCLPGAGRAFRPRACLLHARGRRRPVRTRGGVGDAGPPEPPRRPGSPARLCLPALSPAAFSPWGPGNPRLRGALPGPGRWHPRSFCAWGRFVARPSAGETQRSCAGSARGQEGLRGSRRGGRWEATRELPERVSDLFLPVFPVALGGALRGAGTGGAGRGESGAGVCTFE